MQFNMLKRTLSTRTFHIAVVLACIFVLNAVPAATSAAQSSEVSVRSALNAEKVLNAALVDAATPTPAIDGKAMLFVDGSFYTQADAEVTDRVRSAAQGGMPVLVVGPGLADLCQRLGVGYSKVRYRTESGITDAPIAVSVLRLLPCQVQGGSPVPAIIQVAGDMNNPRSAIRCALGELNGLASWANPQAKIPAQSTGNGATTLATLDSPGNWVTSYYAEYSSGDSWKQGRLNIHRTYSKLLDDGSSTYDWRDVKLTMQIVPGNEYRSNGWLNNWTDAKTVVNAVTTTNHLIDYKPTTTLGQSTISFNVGITAGSQGAAITASMGGSYTVSDVRVQDSSDFYAERFQLKHLFNPCSDVGHFTYLHEPIFCFRCTDGWSPYIGEEFRTQWAKYDRWGWHYWTSPRVYADDMHV